MRFASASLAAGALGVLLLASTAPLPAASERAQTWLAMSDIHLDPFDRSSRPSGLGADSNDALFRSALIQMKRVAPNPTLVLLPGDFLEHRFAEHAGEGDAADSPDEAGARTMQKIATAFGAAFPNAAFAIALGNNDAPCGDYRSADGSAYLARVARVWNPLVDRHSAAPQFAASFVRDGHYTLDAPIRGIRMIVLNSLLFSQEYRGNCGGSAASGARELEWLRATLRDTPAHVRNVIVMHIPPGFDPFSTQYVMGLYAWPFLKANYNDALLDALSARRNKVLYAIAGHAHRFDFRLAGNVPIVVLGSLSPIFDNNPAFYVLHVSSDGSLRDVDAHAFDEPLHEWLPKRSFDAAWGVAKIDGPALMRIHTRLEVDGPARLAWGAQANGAYRSDVSRSGAWGSGWWRVQWCAQSPISAAYVECADIRGRRYGLALALIVAAIAIVALTSFGIRRRRDRLVRGTTAQK
jgi:hypothetical protein